VRPVTAELALLFGRAFDQTPQYWMNLQADFDLKTAESIIGGRLVDAHAFVLSKIHQGYYPAHCKNFRLNVFNEIKEADLFLKK